MLVIALDRYQSLYGVTQRFWSFSGYLVSLDKYGLPLVNKPELCTDLGNACQSDVDHMLGYWYDNIFVVHLCHHQANKCLHYIRESIQRWDHPYYHQVYLTEESRQHPDFFFDLPLTLEPGVV